MKSHVKAVVIGGGVVGCSVLYHLARAGWTDIMLIERSELTSGSSWHAAGGFHTLNGDPNVAKLQAYTVQLYKELEELSGQSCSLHLTGGVMMADTPERMDFLRLAHAKGRYLGMDTELITPSEAKAMFPLMDETNFVGAMWDPVEGHLDPSGTTHAYAKAARKLGAEIVLRNRVVELTQEVDGTWNVVTEQGTVKAEHVVNCGGLWAREIGRMVGVELPVLAMEHMYLLTEPMPEVEEFNKSTGREMVGVLDFKGEIYTRQERNGILLGTYEKNCKPWSPVNTPWDFGHELLPPDIDRIAPSLEIGFKHFPGIEKAGIKQIINGPFTFALDGNPLVGPVQGLTNFWCACAVMAGFSQGGGVGLALSNWMVNGDPGFDVWGMDVARFGEWASLRYTNAKVRENYSRRFSIRFPNEELPAARPAQTTPLYDTMVAQNAVMGDSLGPRNAALVRAEGLRAEGHGLLPPLQRFRACRQRGARHARARRRHRDRQLRQIRGVGPGRRGFPQPPDDQPHAEDRPHRADADAQRIRQADRRLHHRQGRRRPLHDLGLFGRAEIPHALVREASAEGRLGPHPPLRPDAGRPVHRRAEEPGAAAEAGRCRRLDQGVPLHGFPRDGGRRRALHGQPHHLHRRPRLRDLDGAGLPAAGLSRRSRRRARSSASSISACARCCRCGWRRTFRPGSASCGRSTASIEGAMDRFIKLEKNDFIGREAAAKEKAEGGKLRRVSLIVDATDADVMGDEPIWAKVNGKDYGTVEKPHGYGAPRFDADGKEVRGSTAATGASAVRGIVDGEWRVVGWVTSGGYAHYVQKSMAQGYVPAALAEDESEGLFEIEILGHRRPARINVEPPFDPSGEKMRGERTYLLAGRCAYPPHMGEA